MAKSIYSYESKKHVLIIGGSGHGSVIAACIEDNLKHDSNYEWVVDGYVNDYETKIDKYPVVGGTSDIPKLVEKGYYFAWGIHLIARNAETIKAYDRMNIPKERLATIIHHSAFIADNVILSPGCFIMYNAYIGPRTKLGECTMVKANTCLGHDVVTGRLCHIAMGAIVGSYTQMGECSDVAIGAKVLDKHKIGKCSMAGAGCMLTQDIPDNQIFVGVPAKFLKQM